MPRTGSITLVAGLILALLAPVAGYAQLRPRDLQPLTSLQELCQSVQCVPKPPPQITELRLTWLRGGTVESGDPTSVVSPGLELLILGTDFGDYAGSVTLDLQGHAPSDADIRYWEDTRIRVTIRSDITGVPDGPAALTVRLGVPSEHGPIPGPIQTAPYAVRFYATREVIALLDSTAVQIVTCSAADSRNICTSGGGCSVWGRHWGWVFGSNGSDVYSVTLKNGWLFDKIDKAAGNARIRGFTPRSTSATLVVDWGYGFMSGEDYRYLIYIVGPRGVPYR